MGIPRLELRKFNCDNVHVNSLANILQSFAGVEDITTAGNLQRHIGVLDAYINARYISGRLSRAYIKGVREQLGNEEFDLRNVQLLRMT